MTRTRRWIATARLPRVAAVSALIAFGMPLLLADPAPAAGPCGPPVVNPVACENTLPGSPASEWETSGTGDPSIEGFATSISVNKGETVDLKIHTDASSYSIDIYRMGYYGGMGARRVATISPSVTLPQSQPACLNDLSTGLIDCGNWGTSASWAVPSTAVSGIYFAHIVRPDTGADNHVFWIVRDDASHSALQFQTSDTTWQAYNNWGGNSLYSGQPAGRAYKVSYNRPFATRGGVIDGRDFVFAQEYPMVRWLEANGYDLSYVSGLDTSVRGNLITNHQVFLSVGHDEYWSGPQRANVEAARDAGVDIAFFSGNEVFWKTRWEPSIDGSGTANRTLVTYKETRANAKIDPSPEWTGTWRDPRFSPPADGGRPENALAGNIWMVNCCSYPIQVPEADGKMRLWRNTAVANLAAGTAATMPDETLGYEWDEDIDNGYRPAGLFHMSSTTQNVQARLTDYGTNVAPGTATHHLSMYRAASGALVFSAGTIHWSWGLDSHHDGNQVAPDPSMQQATVNLLADMGAQPATLQAGLVAASPSTDTTAPSTAITSPTANASLANGSMITVTGTATDAGGGRVGAVEVSTDNGGTWHPANGRDTWTYAYGVNGLGPATIKARAVDDSGNLGTSASTTVNVSCPCQLYASNAVPGTAASTDANAVEVGVKIRADVDGWITGVRFYKGTGNAGTHTGSVWTTSGQQLATGTFTNETDTGWQTMSLSAPVQVSAGVTYVVSYFAPAGHYAADAGGFQASEHYSPPLHALQDGTDGPNGVYRYGSPGFPTSTYGAANYWVDLVFSDVQPADVIGPTVTTRTPLAGSSSVPTSTAPTAKFSEPVVAGSISMTMQSAAGTNVAGTTSYDSSTWTATFTPSPALAAGTTYTVAVSGASDPAGNAMAAPSTWSFTTANASQPPGTCPCSIWSDSATPAVVTANDPNAAELGVRFRADADGTITGIRFYKGPANMGTHTGTLWSNTGTQLATATFANESTAGWQQVTFSAPVNVVAGTTYVASYHTNGGAYSFTSNQFTSAGVDAPPLHALKNGIDGPSGVFRYGASAFPTNGGGTNYWVDVVFQPAADTTPPTVTATAPGAGETSVPVGTTVRATFNEAVQPATIVFTLAGPGGALPATTSYNSTTRTVTLTPSSPLTAGATYTAQVSATQDTAGNAMTSPAVWSFSTSSPGSCPCSIWPASTTPATAASTDIKAVEVGVKFQTDTTGYIGGIRFYKGAGNAGTHIGNLWSSTGQLLSSAQFSGETASGWQQLTFPNPVAVTAGTTYVASYFAPSGHYAADTNYFATGFDNAPLHALASGVSGANGVFTYGATSTFPTSSFNASNYWVDVWFTTTPPPDSTPPTVIATTPPAGASSVPPSSKPTATFDEPIQPATATFTLTGPSGDVAGTTSYNATTRVLTFTPTVPLATFTLYSAAVTGAQDAQGNAMAAPKTWTFTSAKSTPPPGTCPCSLWPDATAPTTPASTDPAAVEVGVKFTADVAGTITGIRFYKGTTNTGTHIGHLWTSSGVMIGMVKFTAETTAGWQEATLASPVRVSAGTTYVVSYFAPNGHYAVNTSYFKNAGFDNAPLHALKTGTSGPNGVFTYGATSAFPTSGNDANYWVDAVFQPGGVDPAPTVVTRSPAAGATDMPRSVNITATFSEPVQAGSIAITVIPAGGGTPVAGTLTYDSTSMSAATFDPTGNLDYLTTYTVTVTATDLAGTPMVSPDTWTFTTLADTVPPVLSALTVVQASTNSATVSWTTDEPSDSRVDYGTTAASLSLNKTDAALVTNHQVTLTGLTAYTDYYLRVSSNDAALNSATLPAPPAAPVRYQPDMPPTVTTRSPAPGTTGVALNANVTATFSEPVQAGSVTMTVTPAGGAVLAGSLTYDPNTSTATFDPTATLGYGTTYTVSVSATDLAGLAMVSPDTWTFTSLADTTPPVLSALTVAQASATSATVSWTTNEPSNSRVDYGTTATSLTLNKTDAALVTNHQVTLTGLAVGTTYYLRATSADAALNSATLPAPPATPLRYDPAVPTVTTRSPAAGATGVALNANVTATFSEPVQPGSVTMTVTPAGGSALAGTLTYDAASTTATFDPAPSLAYNTTYTVSVNATNLAGTPMTAPATWTFTSLADTTPPVLSALTVVQASATSATVSWTTNEPSNSRVDYGTTATSLTLNKTDAALVTNHQVTLTGLAANTAHYLRATSADAALNSATLPAPPATPLRYAPAVTPFVDATAANFTGTQSSTSVQLTGDGEEALAPTASAEFTGTSLPSGWTSTSQSTGGTSTVANGLLTIDGTRVGTSGTYGSGRSVEFRATFSGQSGQSMGFGTDFSSSSQAAMFTVTGGQLVARSRGVVLIFLQTTDTNLGATFFGAPHTYRIDWNSSSVVYSIDGVVRATHSRSLGSSMRPLVSDTTTGGGNASVDWIRMGPYASTGTYTSLVKDGLAPVAWSAVSWSSTVPSGTTMVVQVRTGNTATPDASWSAWTNVASSGASVGRTSRYLQYRVTFTSGGSQALTPVLNDITVSYAIAG